MPEPSRKRHRLDIAPIIETVSFVYSASPLMIGSINHYIFGVHLAVAVDFDDHICARVRALLDSPIVLRRRLLDSGGGAPRQAGDPLMRAGQAIGRLHRASDLPLQMIVETIGGMRLTTSAIYFSTRNAGMTTAM